MNTISINNTIWTIVKINSGKITQKMAKEINKKYSFTASAGKYFYFFEINPEKRVEKQNFIVSIFEKYNKKGSMFSITDKQFGMAEIVYDTDTYEMMFKGFKVFGGGNRSIRDKKQKMTIYYPVTGLQMQREIYF